MIAFWMLAVAMTVAAVSCVLVPLLRKGRTQEPGKDGLVQARRLAVALYRSGRAELDAELAAGQLAGEGRDEALDALERRLLEDAGTESRTAFAGAARECRWEHAGVAALLLALLPSCAVALYLWLGVPSAVAVQAGAGLGADSPAELMVSRLAARLRHGAGDAGGWAMLARSYTVLGRADDALAAYRRALALAPRDAQLLADYADAQASADGGALNGEAMAGIEAALALDPANPKALALAASAALERRDYAAAAALWQRLAQVPGIAPELAAQARKNMIEATRLQHAVQ